MKNGDFTEVDKTVILPFQSLSELLEYLPKTKAIQENAIKTWNIVNNPKYLKGVCAISGGSDSDIMLDIVFRCDKDRKIEYVWFNTGLEYKATKNHLVYLENKYGIKIKRERAKFSIPFCCNKYGQPFLSKYVSEFISRLQRHNFKWEDKSYDELVKEYPKCKSALKWWCNLNGDTSSFNIKRNKWLKEFLIENNPFYEISNKCCHYAKKEVIKKLLKSGAYDVSMQGVRKSEGGARATAYKGCFTPRNTGVDEYRPIFYYKNSDKSEYIVFCGIINSRCYTEYGLTRTGCCGCPFGQAFEFELQIIENFEPKLYRAVMNIFGNSYKYTRMYKEYCDKMDEIYGSYANYLRNKNERH